MSEEELKAIEFLDKYKEYTILEENKALNILLNLVKKQQEELKISDITSKCDVELIEELRATLKKQQKEIEKKDNDIHRMQELLDISDAKNVNKDKIIDEMAKYIDFDKMDFNCSSLCVKEGCQEQCIKQYFENKVEGSK